MYDHKEDISQIEIRVVATKKDRELFLKLPSFLYAKEEMMQDMEEERKILLGRHILSRYAEHTALIALGSSGKILARCLIAFYKEKDCAYLGFFECIEDERISQALLNRACEIVRQRGKKSIKGPLNFSFWLGYRFKASDYGMPFSQEPYNKSYYISLWESFGFIITDRYYSNIYKKVPVHYFGIKQKKRLEHFLSKGYRVKHPGFFTFNNSLKDIYYAISKLYADFQGYSAISLQDFLSLYGRLKYVINPKMVFLLYKSSRNGTCTRGAGSPVGKDISDDNRHEAKSYANKVSGVIAECLLARRELPQQRRRAVDLYSAWCNLLYGGGFYKEENLAGFTICLPDYGNLLTKSLNCKTIFDILKARLFPKAYIILYLGVYEEHLGLGTAMSELVKEQLSRYRIKSISALIHESKTTKYYYKELKEAEQEYVLMELKL